MPDGSQLAAPPSFRETTALDRSSREPIVVKAFSSGGPRVHHLARLAELQENILDVQTHKYADFVLGTSAGSMLALGLSMPCDDLDGEVPDAETLRPILLDSSRKILKRSFGFDRSNWQFQKPFSVLRAQTVLRSHWGNVTFKDAQTNVAIFTQSKVKDKKRAKPHMFSNVEMPNRPDYSGIEVYRAAAAAISMPRAFVPDAIRSHPIEGFKMYDGAFRRAFPVKQGIKMAKDMQGDSDRPIIVLGTTAGFSHTVSKVSKWIQGTTPREQINRQKEYLARQIVSGKVDPASFIIDIPADGLVPGISESFIDVCDRSVAQMVDAADKTMEIMRPQLLRLKSRLGLTAEI